MSQSLGELKLTVLLEILKAEGNAKKFSATLKDTEGIAKQLNEILGVTTEKTTKLSGVLVNAGLRFEGMMAIVRTLKTTFGDFVREYNNFTSAQKGLESVANFKGINPNAATEQLTSLNAVKSGLLDVSSAASSLKNLLAANFTLEQSIQLINRLSDSAAFGRQSSLSFGQAVASATEGIKNGNSVLVDNAGVTKNLSVMLEQAGYKAQDMMRAGEDAGVRMAIFNGILTETTGQLGDVNKLSSTAAGEAAKFEATIVKLKISFGEFISKAGMPFLKVITDVTKLITTLPPIGQKLILTIISLGAAFVVLNKSIGPAPYALIAMAGALISLPSGYRELAAALMVVVGAVWAFNLALTTANVLSGGIIIAIGLIVSGLTALAASFFDLGVTAKDTTEDLSKLNKEIEDSSANIEKLNELKTAIDLGVQSEDNSQKIQQNIKELAEIYPQLVTEVNSYSGELMTNAVVIQDVINREKELQTIRNDAVLFKMIDGIKDITEEYSDQLKEFNKLKTENANYEKTINTLEKDNVEYAKSLDQAATSSSNLSSEHNVLEGFLRRNQDEISSLKDKILENNAEMYEGASITSDLKNRIIDLISVGFRTNNLSKVFETLTSAIGSSSVAAQTLKNVFASLSSSAIASLLGISSTAKNMSQILWAIAQGQKFIESGNYDAANAMFNIAKGIEIKSPAPKDTKNPGDTKSGKSGVKEKTVKEELNKLKELEKKRDEIDKKIELNKGLEGAVNDLLKERAEIIKDIEYVKSGVDIEELLKENQNTVKDLLEQSKFVHDSNREAREEELSASIKAFDDIHRLKVSLMEDEHEKKLAQIEIERKAALEEINLRKISEEQKAELRELTNQKFNEEISEIGINLTNFEAAKDLASQIQSIFQFGGHTVFSKFLAALQITQQIVALLQSLQLAQGIFSFISKFIGFALAPVTGGASLAGTPGNIGNLPTGGGNNFFQRFSQLSNYINSNKQSNVIREPYFVSIKADGRQLKAVIRQVDKIDNSRLK